MSVRDTSMEAYYREVKPRLGADEQAVFEILYELGPCHDLRILEALNQKEMYKPRADRRTWTINSVTGRRHGLVNRGALAPVVVIDQQDVFGKMTQGRVKEMLAQYKKGTGRKAK